MMTPDEMRRESARKQQALRGLVEALESQKEPSAPAGMSTAIGKQECQRPLGRELPTRSGRLPTWPGGGLAPAKPRPGAYAEVQLTGTKGRTGSGTPLRKKDQAIVLITWPGGSASRTVKGNLTIRYVMESCAAFNQLSGT
jgi:hypothetical protein